MELWRNELYHYGILGQKWGIRRFQNSDGSLTSEGITRYRRDKALNNFGRAITNTSLGQRLAVNLNKGYRTDKKEIKSLYKDKKKEIKTNDEIGKEQKKTKLRNLKGDYKKTLGEARVTAADVNYPWQKGNVNKAIQTQNVGKQFLKSFLVGGGGARDYEYMKDSQEGRRALAVGVSILSSAADSATYGGYSVGQYAYNKYKAGKEEQAKKKK